MPRATQMILTRPVVQAVLAATLVCAAALVWATGAYAKTKVVHWSPFGADTDSLRTGLVATPKYGGRCWTGSFIVHRGYRCSSGNRIYDPCFPDMERDDVVVCVADPWARGVIRLRVTGDLSNSYSARADTTWALRLYSGEQCVMATGGTSVDNAGRRLNFFCRKSRVVLWGNPIRRGPTWHIFKSRSPDPGPETRVAVRTAYIGLVR